MSSTRIEGIMNSDGSCVVYPGKIKSRFKLLQYILITKINDLKNAFL